jgi:hypothetical protein
MPTGFGVTGGPGGQADPLTTATNTGLTMGMNPSTGFSQQYNPSQLMGTIWDSPWAVLPDVFKGINTAGPGYQALRDFGADPLTLYNIMVGGKSDFNDSSTPGNAPGNYANWLNNLYTSMGTTGGRGFNAGELISRIFNPAGSETGPSSSLYKILTAGDASTQMRTLFNLLRDASNVGMNPLAARGYQAYASRAGDAALNAMLKDNTAGGGANNVPVYQYLRQHAPGLT